MTFVPVADVVGTLSPGAHPEGVNGQDAYTGQLIPTAVSENQRGEMRLTPYARQITTGGGKPGQVCPAVLSFGWQNAAAQGDDVDVDGVRSLRTQTSPGVLTSDLAVRRLTPRECERLMSWPDDWTRWTDTGQEIADSHRYRMCGNGVVSNVAEWIGNRIMEALR